MHARLVEHYEKTLNIFIVFSTGLVKWAVGDGGGGFILLLL